MNEQELISVIVPVYKVEKYLERCVESIRRQTYSNLEIILVDDGSPDRCPEICDGYVKLDSRIQVIHKKNGGLSDARNAGIEIAKGKYIGFVDSDDYIHPEMYENLYKAIVKYRADISVCGVKKVYSEQYIIEEQNILEVKRYDGRQAVANIYDAELYLESVVAWNKLYRKELFISIRYPKGKIHEDEFTTYRLFYESDRVVRVNVQYYYYFQRKDSIMGKVNNEISDTVLDAYEEMGDFFEDRREEYLLQLVKYRYLCFLKRRAYNLKRTKNKDDKKVAKQLDNKYDVEYEKYIGKIQKGKRRFRLRLYRWLKICI